MKCNYQGNDIKQIVNKLFSKTKINNIYSRKYPILSNISNNLNNSFDYRYLLSNLLTRSSKTPKSQQPINQITLATNPQISTQLQLLSLLGIILQNNSLMTADKQLINNTANTILKKYQQQRQKQIYKPLLLIILSLITQKHFMSAQGMIGYLKTQANIISQTSKTNDQYLIHNIYRMLVTRANNQNIDSSWKKQNAVMFGELVVERIFRSLLLGHPVHQLIC